MIYMQLFLAFLKTGLFSIGGGLATLPFLYEIAETRGWFSPQMIADMLAVSESTPGPIGVNMATYAGYMTAGISGAIVATVALVLPSLVIVLILAGFIARYRENRFVNGAFMGIRPAVVALVTVALLQVLKSSVLSWDAFLLTKHPADLVHLPSLLLMAALFGILFGYKKIPPIVLVALGAIAGILFRL
ncbi:MAG: chromate transporter [Ruminococcaceae bacterium]|nr:chromate transporter [Oscillospiraceae bacterium]